MPAPAVTADAASCAPINVTSARRYRVFLSYSHADTKWARWLMRRLEGYSVPKRFRGRLAPIGEVGRRIAPVFRDRDELPTTSDLGETIRSALRESATFVVICSPSAARSRWVQEEIIAFKRLHGEHHVFAFIVSGEPKHEGAADDCFSPALRAEVDPDGQLSDRPAEVVAADARVEVDGPKLAFLRLVAGLLGIGFDELRQRELQRRNRRLMVVATCAFAGMALMLGLAAVAWQARNDARRRQNQAEEVLAFMLGGFRDELKKVGKLDLLSRVGNEATKYFDSLDERDLTDTALARQAKALTQIGEVRMEEAKYADAERVFQSAYDRAAALARRHPQQGDMLFERAQAEYWRAFVAWKRGEMGRAGTWAARYRDSALALARLEPNAPRAQREVLSAHHNLAVLEFESGHYEAARPALLAEKAQAEQMLAAKPTDPDLRVKLCDVTSWLGVIAERCGNFTEAITWLSESSSRAKELLDAEPTVARWRVRFATGLPLTANVQARVGQRTAAAAAYAEARTIFEALVAQDPKNQQWRLSATAVHLSQIELLLAAEDYAATTENLRQARAEIERLVAAEPSSQAFTRLLAKAWRFEAIIRLAAHRADAADAAQRAIELGESLWRERRGDDWVIWELAQANLLAGRIAQESGNAGQATRHWQRALDVVGPRLPRTADWRFLDSAAQAYVLLGQLEPARAFAERLHGFGYQPLSPFAAATLASALTTASPNKSQ